MSTSLFVWLFALGIAATLYAYAGFPLLVAVMSSRRARRVPSCQPAPTRIVSVIIPAYNEERNLAAKIRNVLGADYPPNLLDILVVSDASTDGTDAIARSFQQEGVRLLVQERRSGKTAGLNRAVAVARGEVVVFTDANAIFAPDTIGALVRYFDRRRVGLVTGYTRYTVGENGEIAEVTNAYTTLERTIKRAEGRWGCCVGADGAIFALRRSLYRPLRNDDINDFVIPLGVIEQGYECVFAEEAFCSEQPGTGLESEFRRQSRITNRTLRALWRNARLLNPLRFPLFSFLLFSHKVVRFLVPAFLVLAAVSAAGLAVQSRAFLALAACALGALLLAALARSQPLERLAGTPPGRLLHLLYAFVTINLAVLDGWRRFVTGRNDVTWQHDRSAA